MVGGRTLKLNAAEPELLSRLMFALMLLFHVLLAAGKPHEAGDFENVSAKPSEVVSKSCARLNTDLRV